VAELWHHVRPVRPVKVFTLLATVTAAAAAVAVAADSSHAVTIARTIVLDRSIAGVALDQTRASIEQRIGAGYVLGGARTDTSTSPPQHVERVEYDAAGLYVTYVSPGAAARQLRAGKAVVLETTWTSFLTPQGVHVGSALAAVKAIPGVRCFASVCQHGYAGRSGGTSFLIDTIHRKVVRIVVSFAR
jgi:hypothetical protein